MTVARLLSPTRDRQKQGELVISLLNGLKDKTASEGEFDRIRYCRSTFKIESSSASNFCK
ncbi:hypothetical protein IVB12_10255 [Bradyrhizobium sp. 179]|uniref:hypothetical protein n=1 Tax=Bradyrhizobium sp. 179 TaxID=2782648 RepID=UPI001FF72DB2|nr:hypothetical protein [Bradyrhizobium sp. 179]MCK1542335.1 hypothetical protein [Bradyrhizobium sp. 179]